LKTTAHGEQLRPNLTLSTLTSQKLLICESKFDHSFQINSNKLSYRFY
jgi:hypothetical protein